MKTIKITEAENLHLTRALNKFIFDAAKPENILSVEMAENSIILSLHIKKKLAAENRNIFARLKRFLFISK